MIVYGASISPYVRKVLAVAAEKGIDVELKQVGLGSPDPDFAAASPFKKMPALKDGDFTISDSSAIVQYFEAICAEPALIPTEAKARARTIWYEEFADTIMGAIGGKIFFNRVVAPRFLGQAGDMAVADRAEAEELPAVFAYIESVLPASGHLVEDRLTLADIAVASPLVNYSHAGCALDAARHPRLAAFMAAMHARPSFAPLIARERKFLGG